jgi:hypothetical protein
MTPMGARSITATFLLAATLSCSGLGACWKQFVQSADDCCERESAAAPARPCASIAAHAESTSLAPVSEAAIWFSPTSRDALEPRVVARVVVLPASPPPLVLRI